MHLPHYILDVVAIHSLKLLRGEAHRDDVRIDI